MIAINSREAQKICINCQLCCRYVTFTIAYYVPQQAVELKEYYEARGFEVKFHSDCIEVMIKSFCPNLRDWGCAIYSERPALCRQYDGRNDPLLKNRCKLL